MLNLPDVTLICYEVRAHDMVRPAVENMLRRVNFGGGAQIWSDIDLQIPGTTWIEQSVGIKGDHVKATWHEMPKHVKTSHWLNVQWDTGIIDETLWTDEFLEYDYIGAPWPWHPEPNVGNGGFTLYSQRLGQYLCDHRDRFPAVYNDDDTLCRKYRADLEKEANFRWAPLELARRFAFERCPPRQSFGFHGLFNMPFVMAKEDLLSLLSLMNDYVRNKSEYQEFLYNMIKVHP